MCLNIKMKKFINKKPFFIAEISANHCGSLSKAMNLIKLAKSKGADAVKLQTYTPEMMTIKNLNYKIKNGLWKNLNLWKLYKEAQTPLEWHLPLFKYAKKMNIKIFSTPFNVDALKFLEKLNCQAYKVASFEMNDLNLIKEIAKTKKPMIISTGLANIKEIENTYKKAKKFGCEDITLLYCVSNYPSEKEDFNLNNIRILKKKFNCKVGLSDHSIGSEIAKLSIAVGAEVFEKHIATQRQKSGHDIKFSAKGTDIIKYKKDLIDTFKLFQNEKFYRSKKEMKNVIFRRSIYTVKSLKKGDKFNKNNIKTFRPNIGLSASKYFEILNNKAPYNIKKFTPLKANILKVKNK